MATHVLVFGRLHKLKDKEAFEDAFALVSRTVLDNVSDILRDELIHDTNDPCAYILLSEWTSKEAWATWQKAPVHEQQTGLMQQYWKGEGVKIFDTVFCLEQAHKEA